MPKKGRTVRSMRGSVVDFDLMEIKQQMTSAPKSTKVQQREDFVDRRLRRRQRAAERAKQLAASDQSTVEVETSGSEETEVKEELRHVASDLVEDKKEEPVVEEPVKKTSKKPATKKKVTKKRTIKKKVSDSDEK